MQVEIDSIIIPDRIRKDTGDIAALEVSLRQFGQLHPIIITQEGELISGYRRLMAARYLGWATIEAAIVDAGTLKDRIQLEIEENTMRKNFTSEELEEGLKKLQKLSRPPWYIRVIQWFRSLWKRLFKRKKRNK